MLRLFKHPRWRDILLWGLLIIYLTGLGVFAVQDPDLLVFYRNALYPEFSLSAVLVIGITYLYLLATGILCCFYRPKPQINDDQLPSCTVIVPAYNEGAYVERTIKSLLSCDYPADKMEIIAINDGSQDDTWFYIRQGAKFSPRQVTAVNLEKNQGKKHAIYVGTLAARGDIIVTVDSDSSVKSNTLRELMAPFIDPQVGAVAGAIRVKNPEQSFITSLLDVLLVYGCEFLRAAQSVTNLVLCTPGALSAYRKNALIPVLEEWLNQTFMGVPARIGEDRALATLILRSNYKIVHQSTAQATTCVPNTFTGACKMLLRWTRGDIRENLMMTKFTFKNFPPRNVRGLVLIAYWVALTQNLILPFFFIPSFFFMVFAGAKSPAFFLASNALLSLTWASIPAIIYAKHTNLRKAVWALVYGAFCPMLLALLYVYSFLTLRDSRWMTRDLKNKKDNDLPECGKNISRA